VFTEDEMQRLIADANKQIVDAYRGRKHILIADMRGTKTFTPPVAKLIGEYIMQHRAAGCALCVHLSDESVQRLQMLRLARQNSPHDDVTIDVGSLDEAHRVADEMRARLDDAQYAGSIR